MPVGTIVFSVDSCPARAGNLSISCTHSARAQSCRAGAQLVKRSSSSACSSYDSAAVGKGDWGKMNCQHTKRHYSQRQVDLPDLPVAISLRCDSSDDVYGGFDSINGGGAKSDWKMPWGNIECKDGAVLLDWRGTKKSHTLKRNSDVLKIELGKDRQIKFYINDKHWAGISDGGSRSLALISFYLTPIKLLSQISSLSWIVRAH